MGSKPGQSTLTHYVVSIVQNGSSSSIYWTGPFLGVKSPIEACALGGGGVCSLKTVNIKTKFILTN